LKPGPSFLYVIVLYTFCACSGDGNRQSEEKNKKEIILTDDLGREVRLKKEPRRVMALTSSLTEMLYIICEQEEIIGRTQNCDYPPQVLKKPVVNNFPIDYEQLFLLNPDLVFVKEGIIPLDAASQIETLGIPVYYQDYESVEDVYRALTDLGRILNHKDRARAVVDSLKEYEDIISIKDTISPRPSVLILISPDLFSYGKNSFTSDMIRLAGGKNAIDRVFNNKFPQINKEYILKINPDIIIGGEQVGLQNNFFNVYPELKQTNAYKNKRIYTLSEDITARPGPRIIDSVRQLKQLIHDKK
jgi:iron complex transport system substrate-binding protein